MAEIYTVTLDDGEMVMGTEEGILRAKRGFLSAAKPIAPEALDVVSRAYVEVVVQIDAREEREEREAWDTRVTAAKANAEALALPAGQCVDGTFVLECQNCREVGFCEADADDVDVLYAMGEYALESEPPAPRYPQPETATQSAFALNG